MQLNGYIHSWHCNTMLSNGSNEDVCTSNTIVPSRNSDKTTPVSVLVFPCLGRRAVSSLDRISLVTPHTPGFISSPPPNQKDPNPLIQSCHSLIKSFSSWPPSSEETFKLLPWALCTQSCIIPHPQPHPCILSATCSRLSTIRPPQLFFIP